ncbi:lipopolysaccharide biosynthesis protein [Actinomadura sp. WMMB 499]|uniref:lipopolysaccharide biosynthesis protein n=1 Tax=Actinomadura sp. WMMB 499 TaxID=1219491 RepID=UPI00124420DE|nr:hypothetical protein [Actinomadura sp. WMMB 499]QFG21452.1 hypothetical protein F7P10_10240 [Actinomadura sp. WMMB 499]
MRRLRPPRRLSVPAAGPTVLGTAASAVSAATTLVIARGIGAAAFGHFTVVLSIALIVTIGMQLSLHYVMLQELPRGDPARHRAMMATALLSTLVLGGGLTVAGALAAPWLAPLVGVDAGALASGLVLAFAMTLNHLTESFLRGRRRFALVARLKAVIAVAYLGGASWCLLGAGITDPDFYLAALTGTYAGFALAALAAVRIPPRAWTGAWSAAEARAQYRLGAYVTVIAALTGVLFGLDVIFLNHWADRADVGVYSIYNGFPKRLLGVVFTDGIGLALLPALAVADTRAVLRRLVRLAPLVAAGTALVAFAASTVLFPLLGGEYPYSLVLMGLSAAGIGLHAVFNLYSVALSMDGLRGARVLIACLAVATPAALALQAACIARWGLHGGLAGFALGNLVPVAAVIAVAARVYRHRDGGGDGGGGAPAAPPAPALEKAP